MRPFDYIISLCAFAYALGVTHLLFAATRMIRHRRHLVFSWTHALWMALALMLAVTNWFALWDFHRLDPMPMGVIAPGLVIVGLQYFVCALVSPDFEDGESYDMGAFHVREGRTYMSAVLALCLFSLVTNFAAGRGAGVTNEAEQNLPVLAMTPFTILPLAVRATWAQVLSPLVLMGGLVALTVIFYPVLR